MIFNLPSKDDEIKQHVRMCFNYSKKACEYIPNDTKIKDFHSEIKDVWQQVQNMNKPKQEEEKKHSESSEPS